MGGGGRPRRPGPCIHAEYPVWWKVGALLLWSRIGSGGLHLTCPSSRLYTHETRERGVSDVIVAFVLTALVAFVAGWVFGIWLGRAGL